MINKRPLAATKTHYYHVWQTYAKILVNYVNDDNRDGGDDESDQNNITDKATNLPAPPDCWLKLALKKIDQASVANVSKQVILHKEQSVQGLNILIKYIGTVKASTAEMDVKKHQVW